METTDKQKEISDASEEMADISTPLSDKDLEVQDMSARVSDRDERVGGRSPRVGDATQEDSDRSRADPDSDHLPALRAFPSSSSRSTARTVSFKSMPPGMATAASASCTASRTSFARSSGGPSGLFPALGGPNWRGMIQSLRW